MTTMLCISRKMQFLLIIEGCGGQDTESRKRRLWIGYALKDRLPEQAFEPSNLYGDELSWLLEKLNDNELAEVFEAYINLDEETGFPYKVTGG